MWKTSDKRGGLLLEIHDSYLATISFLVFLHYRRWWIVTDRGSIRDLWIIFFFLCGLNKLYNSNSGNLKRDNSPTEIFDIDHTPFLYFICFRSNCRGYAEQNNTMGRTDSDGIHWSAYPVRKCITWLSLLGYRSCIYITRYVNPGIVVQVSYFGIKANNFLLSKVLIRLS